MHTKTFENICKESYIITHAKVDPTIYTIVHFFKFYIYFEKIKESCAYNATRLRPPEKQYSLK